MDGGRQAQDVFLFCFGRSYGVMSRHSSREVEHSRTVCVMRDVHAR